MILDIFLMCTFIKTTDFFYDKENFQLTPACNEPVDDDVNANNDGTDRISVLPCLSSHLK